MAIRCTECKYGMQNNKGEGSCNDRRIALGIYKGTCNEGRRGYSAFEPINQPTGEMGNKCFKCYYRIGNVGYDVPCPAPCPGTVFEPINKSKETKMDFKQMLIDYMYKKAELSGAGDRYFNKHDEAFIRNWTDDICKETWESMEKVLLQSGNLTQIEGCPFCLLIDTDCDDCEYALNHGRCGKDGSEFQRLVSTSNFSRKTITQAFTETREKYEPKEVTYKMGQWFRIKTLAKPNLFMLSRVGKSLVILIGENGNWWNEGWETKSVYKIPHSEVKERISFDFKPISVTVKEVFNA